MDLMDILKYIDNDDYKKVSSSYKTNNISNDMIFIALRKIPFINTQQYDLIKDYKTVLLLYSMLKDKKKYIKLFIDISEEWEFNYIVNNLITTRCMRPKNNEGLFNLLNNIHNYRNEDDELVFYNFMEHEMFIANTLDLAVHSKISLTFFNNENDNDLKVIFNECCRDARKYINERFNKNYKGYSDTYDDLSIEGNELFNDYCSLEDFKKYIEEDGIDVNGKLMIDGEETEITPLIYLTIKGSESLVEYLLTKDVYLPQVNIEMFTDATKEDFISLKDVTGYRNFLVLNFLK